MTPAALITASIQENDSKVDIQTLRLSVDGRDVTGEAAIETIQGLVSIRYQSPAISSSQLHQVQLSFNDIGNPPSQVSRQWSFMTMDVLIVSPDYRTAPGTGLDPGFTIHSVSAAPDGIIFNVNDAENQLKQDSPYYSVTLPAFTVNHSTTGEAAGNFTSANNHPDQSMVEQGLMNPDQTNYVSWEITTYLELPAGLQRFGVTSDDGFRLTVGPTAALSESRLLGIWEGPRGTADSEFNFYVAEAGLYAFRLVWFQINNGANIEWYSVNSTTGIKTLINDPASAGSIKAFRNRSIVPDGVSAPYTFVTLAGFPAIGTSDGPAAAAQFNNPQGIALDRDGDLIIADSGNHAVRKLSKDGIVTTVAGVPGVSGGTVGLAKFARFRTPQDVVVDSQGNIFVSDSDWNQIRKISPDGIVSRFAEGAKFFSPKGLAVDAHDNLYVADTLNNRIQRIAPDGTATVVAGKGQGALDGPSSEALFFFPEGVTVSDDGIIYVSDTFNNCIRKIGLDGNVTTFAGALGISGDSDGSAKSARFTFPGGIATDHSGNLYVTDRVNDQVRKILPSGQVTTLAKTSHDPWGVKVSPSGNVYVSESQNQIIRMISADGKDTTVAGVGYSSTNGVGANARFNHPAGVALGRQGVLFITDSSDATIRKLAPDGTVTTVAGKSGEWGSTDSSNPSAARFNNPAGIVADQNDILYVADSYNNKIRKISSAGAVSTLAGTGDSAALDGPGRSAKLSSPTGITMDAATNLYVAESGNARVRKITAAGFVSTIAGGIKGYYDGPVKTAQFNGLNGIAVDRPGNIYVTDDRHIVRKISPAGVVSSFVGGTFGHADGVGSSASFFGLTGVVSDGLGNLFVTDSWNHTIRKITSSGQVITIGGVPGRNGSVDGVGSDALFSSPSGLAIDEAGDIFIADTGNNTIRVGLPHFTPPHILAHPQSLKVFGDSVAFSVFALSAHPVTFLWLKNGSALAGETNNVLHIPSAAADDAGTYSVAVFNAYGSTISSNATLTVVVPPSIIDQPGDLAVFEGSNAVFSIFVGGTAPFSYQWQRDGIALPNQTNAALTIPNVKRTDAGNYSVTVSNESGTITGRIATLTVEELLRFINQPADITAPQGGDATFTASVDGSGPIAYQWRKEGTALTDATNATLRLDRLQLSEAGSYDIAVSNPYGSITSIVVFLTILAPPLITLQPENQTVIFGTNVSFSVTAEGAGPLTYQWQFEDSALAGQTDRTLQLDSVTRSSSGDYSVLVTGAGGSTSSSNALLRVLVPQKLEPPLLLPDGTVRLIFRGIDGGIPDDLQKVEVESGFGFSGDSAFWNILSGPLVLTNGFLQFEDLSPRMTNRFYRVREHWP